MSTLQELSKNERARLWDAACDLTTFRERVAQAFPRAATGDIRQAIIWTEGRTAPLIGAWMRTISPAHIRRIAKAAGESPAPGFIMLAFMDAFNAIYVY